MSSRQDEILEVRRLLQGIACDHPDARLMNPDIPSKRLVELDPDEANSEAQHWADVRSQDLCEAYHRRAPREEIKASKNDADRRASVVHSLVKAGAEPPISNPCQAHGQL